MDLESLEELANPVYCSKQDATKTQQSVPFSKSFLIGYLYFIQGIMISLPSSIILTYSTLPSYDVLSIFAACTLPFSFKFVSAPIIEKYTSLTYGRRKTWIVITCFLISLCIWILSYYTEQKYMYFTAISFIFVVFLISIQDISTDALGIKQLRKPQLLSFLQTLMQQVGIIFGSMVFIKMTSKSFGETLGLQGSIMTPSSYFKMVSLIVLIPTFIIHYKFKQTLLQSEKSIKGDSLLKIMMSYRVFIDPKSRYFRQGIVFLLFLQGVNFYAHGYQIQLMNSGFSKQTLNTIDNLIMLPLLVVTFVFSSIQTSSRKLFYMRLITFLRLIWQIVGFLIPSHNNWTIGGYSFISNSLAWMFFIVDMNVVNTFPPSALSGMFVTVLYSCRNLGSNGTLSLKIISLVGFAPAAIVGFIYTFLIIIFMPKIIKWIDNGTVDTNKFQSQNHPSEEQSSLKKS